MTGMKCAACGAPWDWADEKKSSHVWTPEELRHLAEEIVFAYCTGQDDHDIENCRKCADMITSVVAAFNNIIAGIAFVKATEEVITSAVDFVKKIAAQQNEPRPFDYTCAIHGKKISEACAFKVERDAARAALERLKEDCEELNRALTVEVEALARVRGALGEVCPHLIRWEGDGEDKSIKCDHAKCQRIAAALEGR